MKKHTFHNQLDKTNETISDTDMCLYIWKLQAAPKVRGKKLYAWNYYNHFFVSPLNWYGIDYYSGGYFPFAGLLVKTIEGSGSSLWVVQYFSPFHKIYRTNNVQKANSHFFHLWEIYEEVSVKFTNILFESRVYFRISG